MPAGKRQRLNPEDRRKLMLQSARDTLAKYGAQGTGVREICKDLGVSPGLLTHYFPGKDSLFVEAYRDMSRSYICDIARITGDTDLTAEARFRKIFDLYFSQEWSDEATMGTYSGFWSLSRTIPELKAAFGETFRGQRKSLELLATDLVRERNVDIDPGPFAAFLLIFLEGIWFQLCLNPDALDKDSIQDICWDWLECYLIQKGAARSGA